MVRGSAVSVSAQMGLQVPTARSMYALTAEYMILFFLGIIQSLRFAQVRAFAQQIEDVFASQVGLGKIVPSLLDVPKIVLGMALVLEAVIVLVYAHVCRTIWQEHLSPPLCILELIVQ